MISAESQDSFLGYLKRIHFWLSAFYFNNSYVLLLSDTMCLSKYTINLVAVVSDRAFFSSFNLAQGDI